MDQHTHANSGTCCGTTMREKIKAKWDKLTENDITEAEKHMEMLSGKVQKAYGRSKEIVDREVSEFRSTLSKDPAPSPIL